MRNRSRLAKVEQQAPDSAEPIYIIIEPHVDGTPTSIIEDVVRVDWTLSGAPVCTTIWLDDRGYQRDSRVNIR